jgi:hypothetical protein
MKPLVCEGFVIGSDASGRAMFLRKGRRTVTADLGEACRFDDIDAAERALRAFVERHRHAHQGVSTWEVLWVTTRTTFEEV